MSKSKVDIKALIMVAGSAIGGIAGTKLLRDNIKNFVKDDKMRGLVAPGAVIAAAVIVGMKKPKLALISTAVTAGAAIMGAGGVLDYMDRTKTKNDILGLAGDNDEEVIYLNGVDELLEYAVASMPPVEQRQIPEQSEVVYVPVETTTVQGDKDFLEALNGDDDSLSQVLRNM